MQDKNRLPAVSSEIASLWSSYMSDSLASCMLRYFLKVVEDIDIKPHLQYAFDLSQQHLQIVANFFNEEGLPVPQGFTDNDINLDAPRLYSDPFMLFYLAIMSRAGLNAYSLAYNNVPRADIRGYFAECIRSTVDMYDKIAVTLLNKGLFIKAPYVEVSKEISFIKKESFFAGILAEPRPILSVEIMHIFNNLLTCMMTKSLVTGFGQVSHSKEVKEHMFDKVDTFTKHIQSFSLVLSNDNVPIPSSYDMSITDSMVSPFSDKLMMFHATTLLGTVVLANYGASIGTSFRNDLIANYIRFITDIAQSAKNGTDIMIGNGWLEQPPQVIDHRKLAGIK
jgi:hypothetical protein